jgi:hypothetical protein
VLPEPVVLSPVLEFSEPGVLSTNMDRRLRPTSDQGMVIPVKSRFKSFDRNKTMSVDIVWQKHTCSRISEVSEDTTTMDQGRERSGVVTADPIPNVKSRNCRDLTFVVSFVCGNTWGVRAKRIFQLLVLIGVILLAVLGGGKLRDGIESLRGGLRTIPVYAGCIVFCACHFV